MTESATVSTIELRDRVIAMLFEAMMWKEGSARQRGLVDAAEELMRIIKQMEKSDD